MAVGPYKDGGTEDIPVPHREISRNQHMSDKITDAVAAAAVVSPLWLTSLTTVSQVATVAAPILGCIWLSVQIFTKLYDFYAKKRLRNEVKDDDDSS